MAARVDGVGLVWLSTFGPVPAVDYHITPTSSGRRGTSGSLRLLHTENEVCLCNAKNLEHQRFSDSEL